MAHCMTGGWGLGRIEGEEVELCVRESVHGWRG